MGLPCHGSCKERLAGSGRAHQQGSLGKIGSDIRILLGIVQEVHNLLQGILGFLLPCHVGKGNSCLVLSIYLCIGLSEGHGVAAAHPLGKHTAHDVSNDNKHQNGRHPGHQEA